MSFSVRLSTNRVESTRRVEPIRVENGESGHTGPWFNWFEWRIDQGSMVGPWFNRWMKSGQKCSNWFDWINGPGSAIGLNPVKKKVWTDSPLIQPLVQVQSKMFEPIRMGKWPWFNPRFKSGQKSFEPIRSWFNHGFKFGQKRSNPIQTDFWTSLFFDTDFLWCAVEWVQMN